MQKYKTSWDALEEPERTRRMSILLDVTLLDPLLVQILDELLSLHPVDERAGISAVAEESPARQVQSTSCGDRK